MSEKSLSIKIRRARIELRIMQNAASIIYHKLSVINNIDRSKTENYYAVNSSVFSNELTYQTAVLKIVQQLSDAQQNKANGGVFSGAQTDQFYAMILDLITTKLTATDLVTIGENSSSININVQHCNGSMGGVNYIIGTEKNVTEYLKTT